MSTMAHGIGWFEIGTDAPEATQRFYGTVFGWTFAADEAAGMPYQIATTPAPDSVKGGVLSTGGQLPNYAMFCIVVQDVAATCVSVESAGGKVLVPATTTGDGLVWAHLADPSGNRFGIFAPPSGQDS
jgi:uncharacterized protein